MPRVGTREQARKVEALRIVYSAILGGSGELGKYTKNKPFQSQISALPAYFLSSPDCLGFSVQSFGF